MLCQVRIGLKFRIFKIDKVSRRSDTLYIFMLTKYHTDVIVSRRRDLALTDCVVQRGWLFYVQMIEVNILRFTHHVGGRDLVFKKWQLREVNPFCLIHSNLEVLTPILAPMLTCFTVFLTKLHIFCCVLYMMYFIHKSSNLQRLVLLVMRPDEEV